MSAHNKLLTYWKSLGYEAPPGASPEAVAALEIRHRIILPADFRQYLLAVGGTGFGSDPAYKVDSFTFWKVDELTSVSEYCSAKKICLSGSGLFDNYILFSDYMLECYFYAISVEEQSLGQIILIPGPTEPRILGWSFTKFIDLYLERDRSLHYGANHSSN